MKALIGRGFLVAWFVGMVLVAVHGAPAQGQPAGENLKHYIPTLMRYAPAQSNPPFRAYVGLAAANVDGDFDIYTLRADGSEMRRLTDNSLHDMLPQWSPDGRQIVFVQQPAHDEFPATLMVMNSDGSALRPVVEGWQFESLPEWKWAPDSKSLLIQAQAGGLWRVGTDGTPPIYLGEGIQIWGWSPYNTYLYWLTWDGTLWVESEAGGNAVAVAANVNEVFWHPTERELLAIQIVDAQLGERLGQVFTPDGSEGRTLFEGAYIPIGWIQEGEGFMLKTFIGPQPQDDWGALSTVSRSGGAITPLTDPDESLSGPLLTPDGDAAIYYIFNPINAERTVYYHPLNGNERQQIGIIWELISHDFLTLSQAYDKSGIIFTMRVSQKRSYGTVSYFVPLYPTIGEMQRMYGSYLPFANTRAISAPRGNAYPYDRVLVPHQVETNPMLVTPLPVPDAVYFVEQWRHQP